MQIKLKDGHLCVLALKCRLTREFGLVPLSKILHPSWLLLTWFIALQREMGEQRKP